MSWLRDTRALVGLAAAATAALAGCGGGAPSQQQIQQQVQQQVQSAQSQAQQAANSASNLLKAADDQAQVLSAAQQIQKALAQSTSALSQASKAEKAALALAAMDRERQWLAAHGTPGSAVVLAVRDTGTTDTGPGVLAVTGSYGAVEYILRLRVTVPGQPAYTTSVDQPVASDLAGGLHPGVVLPVKADPRHLAYVLVG